jgi:hypothetical protein
MKGKCSGKYFCIREIIDPSGQFRVLGYTTQRNQGKLHGAVYVSKLEWGTQVMCTEFWKGILVENCKLAIRERKAG